MQRNFLRGLLICLLPCALFGAFAAFGQYRKGIDLAGGTILVYEVDLEKAQRRQQLESGKNIPLENRADDTGSRPGLSSEKMQQLAESLKRRIDPADLRNVIIRPSGDSRVEIILPFTPATKSTTGEAKAAATEDFVQTVKNVVARVGVLEFRILANEFDDPAGIAAAEARINELTPEEADKLAKAGNPPPAPAGEFTVTINDVTSDKVTYSWNELDRNERESLGLNNAAEKDPARGGLWRQMNAQRGKTVRHGTGGEGKQGSMLLYSREFKKENRTKDEDGKQVEYYVLTRVSPVDQTRIGGDITLTAYQDQDRSLNLAIGFRFNGAGARQFGEMTGRNKPSGQTIRHLAVLLDDKVQSAPTLNSKLTDGGIIQGPPGRGLEKKYVDEIVQILRSGALTAELKPNPVSENTVGATLGQDTIRKGVTAIGLAFAAVLLFMLGYYRFAGLVACIALLANLLLTIGVMVALKAAFTLAGMAGIVLMLGMAVDANVLIYERLREERDKGATLSAAIRNGYDRAFAVILDTHLTSIFTSVVLYTFGNDNLKGFAVSLTVGLVISLFTSLYMTRLMFDFWMHKRWLTNLRMMRLFSRPNINFMRIRFYMFALTVALTVVGLGLFLFRGERGLNVDFRGGTVYGGRLTEPIRLSGDGKGLLDRLAEDRQKAMLKVRDVIPFRPASGEDGADAAKAQAAVGNTYQILYEGSPNPVVVTLANPPEGATEAERLENLKTRAGSLPDVSIEQVFLTGEDLPAGMSKSFTLRTTEREKEIVQIVLDRVLRDENSKPLLAMAQLTVPAAVSGPAVDLTFDPPTSVGYVEELLKREFALAYRTPLAGPAFELTGVPTRDPTEKDSPERRQELVQQRQQEVQTGKYARMSLSVAKNSEFGGLRTASVNAAPAAVAGSLALTDPRAVTETAALAEILQKFEAAFESRPVPDRLETFDPTLAADTRAKALYAILASWAAILLYLWFRFGNWTFGLAAVLCLVHDLCFTLGAIAASHYVHDTWIGQAVGLQDFKIDLAAVAALLTLVGYSVNEIIVNFARIREVRGKNPVLTPQTINDSVNQTLSRTILTSTTVFLVSFVLYAFGGEGVHLFAFVMATGVMISTYSSIYIASPLLLILGEGKAAPGSAAPAATQPAGTTA